MAKLIAECANGVRPIVYPQMCVHAKQACFSFACIFVAYAVFVPTRGTSTSWLLYTTCHGLFPLLFSFAPPLSASLLRVFFSLDALLDVMDGERKGEHAGQVHASPDRYGKRQVVGERGPSHQQQQLQP